MSENTRTTVHEGGKEAQREGSAGYPTELVRTVETTTGLQVLLRPIRDDDGDRLVAFHKNLSSSSIYERYFTLHARLSPAEVDHFTHVDYVGRLALVAELETRIIAVARYERIPNTPEAEVAFLVTDEFQHQGIGTLLLHHLADAARSRGISIFVAQTLHENHHMLDVFLNSGFHVTCSCEYGTVSVRFPIVPEQNGDQTAPS
jgi:GNAT superfamily N-acetyltransferase